MVRAGQTEGPLSAGKMARLGSYVALSGDGHKMVLFSVRPLAPPVAWSVACACWTCRRIGREGNGEAGGAIAKVRMYSRSFQQLVPWSGKWYMRTLASYPLGRRDQPGHARQGDLLYVRLGRCWNLHMLNDTTPRQADESRGSAGRRPQLKAACVACAAPPEPDLSTYLRSTSVPALPPSMKILEVLP